MIETLKRHEGFRRLPYYCSAGRLTIGYGTKLPLTQTEKRLIGGYPGSVTKVQATQLLLFRLQGYIKELNEALPWLKNKPQSVKEVLYNMSYQMGVKGVLKFKRTLKYIKNKEYKKASSEMLDSKWAREDSPKRAKELSEVIGSIF